MIKLFFSATKIYLSCLTLFFQLAAWSQLPHTLWFHPLTAEEGLSGRYNWYVYHDSEGFVWVSSLTGLNRFDGVNVRQYYSVAGDTTSLLGEIIHSRFLEDKRRNIWFSSLPAIHCYVRQRDNFQRFFLRNDKGEKIKGEYQVYFLEKDTFLWVGTGDAIYRFDIHHPYQPAKKVLETKYFRCEMDTSGDGAVRRLFLYDTPNGLKIFPIKDGQVVQSEKPLTFFPDSRVRDVLLESDSRVWVITDKQGLISLNLNAKNRWRVWGKFGSDPMALASWDDRYLIVVARGKEIFIIDKESGEVHPVVCKFIEGDERAMQSIVGAYLDEEENLWISDEKEGLHYANLRKTKFRSLSKFPSEGNNKNYSYWAIEEDKAGNIWLGTEPGGIFLLNKNGQLIRHYSHQPRNPNALPSNQVRDIVPDSKGNIWIATTEGLSWLPPRQQNFQLIPTDSGKTNCVINQLYLTKSGRLIAASEGDCNGVYELKEIKGKKLLVKILSVEPGAYQTFFEDTNGNLYCVRNSSEICVFNFENDKLVLKDSFPVGGLVNCFWEERDSGILYFATSNGLVKIDKNLSNPVVYTVENGLPGNFIGELLGLPGQKLWLGTNKGLTFFDGATGSIQAFSLADGALSSEFHITAALKRSNGELWFGGSNGITIVPAGGKFEVVKNPPKVLITKIKVNNVERDSFDKTGRTNVTQLQHIVLPHDQSTLTFEFVAIEYSDPQNNKLMYRLYTDNNSSSAVWVQCADAKGFAQFSYLPHGEYVLEIAGISSDGIWSAEPRRLFIKIRPPFYLTYEFFAACAFVGLIIGYFIFRAAVQRQLREKNLQLREQSLHIEKQDALTQERNRIASEMHDDLGGGLTSIRMLSSRVQKKINNPEMQGQVDKIAHYSQELVQKMGEIIWAMNSNFDTVENLIAYIRRYATEFLDLSGLRYHIREPEESLDFAISGERRRNIYLAVKESLHNVVKHANAERVSISFEIKNENLVVQVQDDGKGIDLEKANQFGNGLYNMRKRLHDIGGEMLVENRDGTLLTFIAPLEKTSQL